MRYESPTIELLGDSRMANVEGTAFLVPILVIAVVVLVAYSAAAMFAAAMNVVYIVNVAQTLVVLANWVT